MSEKKEVLISLKPYYYYLIGEGIKKIEVRKSRPKAKDWNNNAWFYMSKDEKSFSKIPKEYQEKYRKHFGKVGLKFTCNKIDEYLCKEYEWEDGDVSLEYHIRFVEGMKTCLEYDEIREYGNEKPLYFWHISDLKIYGKPRDLSEFQKAQYDYGKIHIPPREMKRPFQSWGYCESLGE